VRGVARSLDVAGIVWDDHAVSTRELVEGKSPSLWAVLARQPRVLEPVWTTGEWVSLFMTPPDGFEGSDPVWTDTFSSPLGVIKDGFFAR